MLAIDHVVYAVRDLDEAAARFRDEHGLTSYAGGEHEGLGTANRIVPLGDSYVELITVVDRAAGEANMLGQRILETGDGLLAWVVRIDDIARFTERRPFPALPGKRALPDGTTLSWQLAAIDVALEDPSMPFFIEWGHGTRHPGAAPADHDATGIAWVEVTPFSEARLRAWLFHEQLPVRIVDGDRPALHAVGLASQRGEIVLR